MEIDPKTVSREDLIQLVQKQDELIKSYRAYIESLKLLVDFLKNPRSV